MRVSLPLAALALLLSACSGNKKAATPDAEPSKAQAAPRTETSESSGASFVVLTPEAQKHAAIQVEELRDSEVADALEAPGVLTLNADRTSGVGAVVDGRLVFVGAKVGDTVRQGQVLARMHSHEVHDSRAEYRKAEEALRRARSHEAYTRRVRERQQKLFDLKAASRGDLELAEMELRSAETAVKSAEAELNKQRVHLVEFLEVPIEEDRDEGHEHDSDDVPLKSTMNGIVIERPHPVGSVVSMGQEVFRISDLSSLWMIANVNEADLPSLRVGGRVRVRVKAHPDRVFMGSLLRMGEALDPTTRTLRVRVLVPNPQGFLKPEMYATASFDRNSLRRTLTVSRSAVQDIGGQPSVFVAVSRERFEVRPVQTAPFSDERLEVINGLKPGDRIVTRGSFALKAQLLRSLVEEE
jgi:membrane fusion protein, heavy metal efflux system